MSESVIETHTRVGNSYVHWKRTAERLFASGEILRRERERWRRLTLKPGPVPKGIFTTWTAVMLTAFGIECLIKAVWLKRGHQLVRNGKYVEMIKGERHCLGRLCQTAGIVLNQHEEAVLARLSDIAGSIGRYPIGKRARQTTRGPTLLKIKQGQSSAQITAWWSTNDDHIIDNLIARLDKELPVVKRSQRAA